MKKLLSLFMVAVMSVSLVACSNESETKEEVVENHVPEVTEGTFGDLIWNDFETAVNSSEEVSVDSIVEQISNDENVPIKLMPSPINEEFFPGFKEGFKPTGFKSGSVFSPMIGSIPFVGYVFEISEGTDIEAFMKSLEENSDPRWNICVEADQTVVGSIGQYVLFVMCPESFD